VALIGNGNASQVDYAGFKTDRAALKAYLDACRRSAKPTIGAGASLSNWRF
jgi:hypothetical protein